MPAPSTIRASVPLTTSAPQLFSLPDGQYAALADREAHRAAFFVEEAGIDGNDSRQGRRHLLHGLPRRRATGWDEAKVCFTKIDPEGVT